MHLSRCKRIMAFISRKLGISDRYANVSAKTLNKKKNLNEIC